jgi:hypothetical protein
MDEKPDPVSSESDPAHAEDTGRSVALTDTSAQQALSDEAARKKGRELDDALCSPAYLSRTERTRASAGGHRRPLGDGSRADGRHTHQQAQ